MKNPYNMLMLAKKAATEVGITHPKAIKFMWRLFQEMQKVIQSGEQTNLSVKNFGSFVVKARVAVPNPTPFRTPGSPAPMFPTKRVYFKPAFKIDIVD